METLELTFDFITETEKAMPVSDGTEEIWIPKSLIQDEWQSEGTVSMTLPLWFAEKEGLL